MVFAYVASAKSLVLNDFYCEMACSKIDQHNQELLKELAKAGHEAAAIRARARELWPEDRVPATVRYKMLEAWNKR